MNKLLILALYLTIGFGLQSCGDGSSSGSSNSSSSRSVLLPNVSGAAGEVLVVMDNFNWKNNAGDIIRKTLEQEYPALNQPEPLFDVTHINAGAFDDLFKMHRTIVKVIVDQSVDEPIVRYSQNIWAKPQLVISVESPDSYKLETLLEQERERMLQSILVYDRKRLQDVYRDSKDQEIRSVLSKYNISLTIPRGYNIDFHNEEFASFSIETPKTSQVVFVYQYPHRSERDLDTENIILVRNSFLKKYTVGPRPNSYLTTAEMFPPISFDVKKNGDDLVEVRGLWEMQNGFMGGPFISHSIVDKNRNMIVVAEGYVYNPNNKKRNMMRQLEAIIYSLELLEK